MKKLNPYYAREEFDSLMERIDREGLTEELRSVLEETFLGLPAERGERVQRNLQELIKEDKARTSNRSLFQRLAGAVKNHPENKP